MLLRVRYGGKIAPLTIIGGLVLLAWPLVGASLALGRPTFIVSPLLLVGTVLVLGGLVMLGSTYFTVEEHAIVIHALLGPMKRTIAFETLADVTHEAGKVFVRQTGLRRKRIGIYVTQARSEDWSAFAALLAARRSSDQNSA